MILSQERAFLKAEKQLQALVDYVRQSTSTQERIDQVERSLMKVVAAGSLAVGGVCGRAWRW